LVNKNEYKSFRERLANKVEEIKFKKFDLYKIKEKVFKIDEGIDNQSLCDFCQKRKGEPKEGYVICDVCKNFVDIGKNLVNNRFLAISKEKKDNDIEVFKGYYLHFFDNPSSVKLKDDVALYDIKTDEEFEGYEKWELSSYVALRDDFKEYEEYLKEKSDIKSEILTLEELAALSVKEEIGEKRRGVEAIMALKGDADGMGDFIKTSKVTDSFSKFNFFAKMVDYYFSVYVPISFMQKEPFYTVFAGGDDLFVLGAWDKTIELAKNVRGDFKKFTDNRLSFSTGLIMSKANKPVNFIAEFAEKALESAKDFCCKKTDKSCKEVKECKEGDIKKDAVSVFGYTLNWDFYNMVRKEVLEEFKKFEKNYEVKTTMLYRLLDLADMRIEMEKDIKKSIWKSKLCYFYRRNISEKDNGFLAFLDEKIENTPKEFKTSLIEYIYKRRSK
jgi:CRISPR-associated protein Csm1